MPPYFDVANAAHKNLLPPQLREKDDLAQAAEGAEADVIDHYTFSTIHGPGFRALVDATTQRAGSFFPTIVPEGAVEIGENVYVGLRGYAVDAAGADALLADRLRRTIAEVIRWRFAQWEKTPSVKQRYSLGQQGRGENYRDDAEDRFPPGFGSRLELFDVRPTAWVA